MRRFDVSTFAPPPAPHDGDTSDGATQVVITLAEGDTKRLRGKALLHSLNLEGLRERLDHSEALERWATRDGRTRELFVLPAGGADVANVGIVQSHTGVQVVVVTEGDDGRQVAQLLGAASGLNLANAEPTDVSWGEHDIVALTFSKPGGGEIVMGFQTSDEALDDDADAVRLVLTDDAEPIRVRSHKHTRDRE